MHASDPLLSQFEEQGFIGPLRAFSASEMVNREAEIRRSLVSVTAKDWPKIRNRHLDWPLIGELCANEAIVSVVRELVGPNLLIWRSNIFPVGEGEKLSWHQDEYHTLLEQPFNHVSVHVALSRADEKNCLMIIPGSHKYSLEDMERHGFLEIPGTRESADFGTPHFYRHPEVAPDPVKLTLEPGEFIVFHPSLIHGADDKIVVERKISDRGLVERIIGRGCRELGAFLNLKKQRPKRFALAVRITVPDNQVKEAAFSQTLPRVDRCVLLSGENIGGLNELAVWNPTYSRRTSKAD